MIDQAYDLSRTRLPVAYRLLPDCARSGAEGQLGSRSPEHQLSGSSLSSRQAVHSYPASALQLP